MGTKLGTVAHRCGAYQMQQRRKAPLRASFCSLLRDFSVLSKAFFIHNELQFFVVRTHECMSAC